MITKIENIIKYYDKLNGDRWKKNKQYIIYKNCV